jgi:cation diffusion facilitator CzcD-associated flavoprotein CzcO
MSILKMNANEAMFSKTGEAQTTEHFDIIIVGAGISGVGGAYHLTKECPDKSFVVLEALENFGGTWWTHRYPGIRSDSDLHTFGYRFKPWTSAPIASSEEIRKYMGEVIEENDLAPHIRYRHRIESAQWSSETNLWTVQVRQVESGELLQMSAAFLWMCQGYYRHSQGYTPEWPGMEDYQGVIIHPQHWPEGFAYDNKRVVVIGSGATAATVVPAIAEKVAHVTLLQRSPTYFIPGRNAIELAETLRELEVDETWIHEIVRRRILKDQATFARRASEEPEVVTQELLGGVRAILGQDYDIKKHFTPSYRPWRQRVAFVPGGDLFQSIKSGKASVETDEIERFTAGGILLKSGKSIEADVVVTATGFNLSALGDIVFDIDGKRLDLSQTVTYRGMMFTGVPNLLWVMGYFRASWTLRADLVADFFVHLLREMGRRKAHKVVPMLRAEDAAMALGPWVSTDNFNPGYITRGMHLMPRSGDKPEWQHTQDYWGEKDSLPTAFLSDACLKFE